MKLSLPIYLHMNMQMSKAEFLKFCLFPTTKLERDFIKILRVFSLNCMIPDPILSIKTAKSLIESSAIVEFLSQQYSEATKIDKNLLLIKLISYPQLDEKDVKTSCAEIFMEPISVDAFLMRTGKKAYTAF